MVVDSEVLLQLALMIRVLVSASRPAVSAAARPATASSSDPSSAAAAERPPAAVARPAAASFSDPSSSDPSSAAAMKSYAQVAQEVQEEQEWTTFGKKSRQTPTPKVNMRPDELKADREKKYSEALKKAKDNVWLPPKTPQGKDLLEFDFIQWNRAYENFLRIHRNFNMADVPQVGFHGIFIRKVNAVLADDSILECPDNERDHILRWLQETRDTIEFIRGMDFQAANGLKR